MTTKQVLSRARRTIQRPERWTKRAFARDKNGAKTASCSPDACQWCAEGALRRACNGDYVALVGAELALRCGVKKVAPRSREIYTFNDYHGTDHERVLRAFDKALEECV